MKKKLDPVSIALIFWLTLISCVFFMGIVAMTLRELGYTQ